MNKEIVSRFFSAGKARKLCRLAVSSNIYSEENCTIIRDSHGVNLRLGLIHGAAWEGDDRQGNGGAGACDPPLAPLEFSPFGLMSSHPKRHRRKKTAPAGEEQAILAQAEADAAELGITTKQRLLQQCAYAVRNSVGQLREIQAALTRIESEADKRQDDEAVKIMRDLQRDLADTLAFTVSAALAIDTETTNQQ